MKNGLKTDIDGDRYWYKNDQLHREDGPAIEYKDGGKGWCKNGMRHREDGPAFEFKSGYKRWFINDLPLTESEFNEWQIQNRKNKIEALNL